MKKTYMFLNFDACCLDFYFVFTVELQAEEFYLVHVHTKQLSDSFHLQNACIVVEHENPCGKTYHLYRMFNLP